MIARPASLLFLIAASSCGHAAMSQRSPDTAAHIQTLHVPVLDAQLLEDRQRFGASAAPGVLRDAMTTTGIIQVTGIPGLAKVKREALVAAAACAQVAPAARATKFADGTNRRTLASIASGTGVKQPFDLGAEPTSPHLRTGCGAEFHQSTTEFRGMVDRASAAFLGAMGLVFDTQEAALLVDSRDPTMTYDSLAGMVANAEHLEHFHAYTNPGRRDQHALNNTIDMHTDQGLFIAFTPAIRQDAPGAARATAELGQNLDVDGDTGPFFIRLQSGATVRADFGPSAANNLVFMLGDGVARYFNPRSGVAALRPTPHAMTIPSLGRGGSRLWYGRMFLPPQTAIDTTAGTTIGELHRGMLDDVTSHGTAEVSVGCSRASGTRRARAADDQCAGEKDTIYCWMRCMPYTDEANPEICAAAGTHLKCTSQRDQVWRLQDGHGDFNPACTADPTNYVTEPPKIPDRPANCQEQSFEAFTNASEYDAHIELLEGKLALMWSVVDGAVRAKLAFDGVVGWMAIGHENPTGGHNGMNGAPIVMGLNDPDPDIVGAPYIGTGVNEFVIHNHASAFRHWSTPYRDPMLRHERMLITDCHSSMQFTASSIGGWPLAVGASTQPSPAVGKPSGESEISGSGDRGATDAVDRLIYAVHTDTYLKGYHSCGELRRCRGKLQVDWSNGIATLPGPSTPGGWGGGGGVHDGGAPAGAAGGHSHGSGDVPIVNSTAQPPPRTSSAAGQGPAPQPHWALAAATLAAALTAPLL